MIAETLRHLVAAENRRSIDRISQNLRRCPRFSPEYRGKNLFAISADFHIPECLKAEAGGAGVYLATIRDNVFEIAPGDNFRPRAFGIREV